MATAAATWTNPSRLPAIPPDRSSPPSRTFAIVALVLFLVAQCLDGLFTYIGVTRYGLGIEANPVVATLMANFGVGAGLLGAKLTAAILGIGLHMFASHRAVAALATFYFTLAIAPWTAILFL